MFNEIAFAYMLEQSLFFRMSVMKKLVLLTLVSMAAIFTGCTGSEETVIPDREKLSTEIVEEYQFPTK